MRFVSIAFLFSATNCHVSSLCFLRAFLRFPTRRLGTVLLGGSIVNDLASTGLCTIPSYERNGRTRSAISSSNLPFSCRISAGPCSQHSWYSSIRARLSPAAIPLSALVFLPTKRWSRHVVSSQEILHASLGPRLADAASLSVILDYNMPPSLVYLVQKVLGRFSCIRALWNIPR
jgi:hypothetical protein